MWRTARRSALSAKLRTWSAGIGPVPLLIVRGASGEVLVPFVKTYLRRIDLEARRVEMALPEGLTGPERLI